MNNNEVILHGECMVFRSTIPANAKPKQKSKTGFVIVADSETTGNHHVVDETVGVDFYEADGKLYMNSSVDTTIRCLHAERHDTISLARSKSTIRLRLASKRCATNGRVRSHQTRKSSRCD